MDTPAWVCTYANNQWELSGDIPDDPKESGYTEAMQVAENCTIIILDKEAIVFERVQCCSELFQTLVDIEQEEDEKEVKGGLRAV